MDPLPRYRDLLRDADAWFDRAARAHAAEIRCRRGCDACCRGLFDITPLDAALVAAGAAAADPATRAALREGALQALEAVRAAAPDWGPPWRIGDLGTERFDALCDVLDTLPCPALAADGACRIYEHRPLVCRLHGLPMYDPASATSCGGECPLNFPPVGLAERPALHFAHGEFERRELALLGEVAGAPAAEDPEPFGTIVAAALLG